MSGTKDTTIREIASAAPGPPRASLVFYFRDGAKLVADPGAPIVVGRTWPADVVLDDPSVSRSHARFTFGPDGAVAFEDLGSTNGTRLNGVVAATGRLGPGDEVRLGEVSVALHVLSVVPGISGLAGYDAFVRLLGDEVVRARTFTRPLSLLMVGARAPGRPLRTWAPALLEKLRPVDRAAVYATDAVLVALPEVRRPEAEALGQAIVGTDAALRFGSATFPEDGTSVDVLLASTRGAMIHGEGPTARGLVSKGAIVKGDRMRPVWDLVERVADSTLPVLIVGETGSGKEVVAGALHGASSRRGGPQRSINCAAIPQSLVESALFGHERGAFTGADRTAKGLFEQAHGGTLLLDEIGELPPGPQAVLLRVLETKRLVRVGGEREIAIDVRVVAATHRDLERLVAEGSFRADLYYRLHGVTIEVPPLRERSDEIPTLAAEFIAAACRENGRQVRCIDDEAMKALLAWRWPGNVRELKNVIERAVVIARSDAIGLADLPEKVRGGASRAALAPMAEPAAALTSPPPAADRSGAADAVDYKERLRREMQRFETELILDALARTRGNVTAAAQALRIPVRTLTHKMQAFGIKKRFDG